MMWITKAEYKRLWCRIERNKIDIERIQKDRERIYKELWALTANLQLVKDKGGF